MTETIRHFLTEHQRTQICEMLASGGSYEMAADGCGVTLEMIQKEESFDPLFKEFTSHAVLRSEVNLLRNVVGAASDSKQWRAAAWLLERLYPDRYARRKPNTLSLKDHGQRVQQLSDFIKSVVPEDVWPRLKQHLDDLLDCSPAEAKSDTANEKSLNETEMSAPGEGTQVVPYAEKCNSPDRRENDAG
jgi:hypothetical protein